jgi:Tn3 transposase DDE domain/Phage integrase family
VLARRREPADWTRAIPFVQLERLWRRDDVAVREKVLWRLLYETAARAGEVLSLNVEDLELENKRARVRSEGGDVEWLHLQAGSATVAVSDRRAVVWPAVLVGSAAGAGADAGGRGSVSGDRAGAVVLPPRGGAVQRGAGWVDAASVATLGDHAPRRGRRQARVADGQEPPHVAAVAAALLIVNTIVLYNTIYTQRVIDQIAASTGSEPRDQDVERLSPLGSDQITLTGRYRVLLPAPLHDRGAYRALNTPGDAAAA